MPIVLATSDFHSFVTESFLPFEVTVNFEISYFLRGINSCSDFSQRWVMLCCHSSPNFCPGVYYLFFYMCVVLCCVVLCVVSWDLISSLYFNTIYPMVVLLLWCGAYFVHSRMTHTRTQGEGGRQGQEGEEASAVVMSRLLRRYVFLGLLFLYMIFPSVSAVIFSMFSCTDSDPDAVTDGHTKYLHSDYSISCASSRYHAAKVYAIFMVFLYPIGIPTMFFALLYYYRRGIEQRTRVDKLHQPCYVIEFLWFPFTPPFWFFECIDIVYRVSLTGFLVLLKQGSAEQIMVGMLLSFVYVQLHQHVTPHEDRWVQRVKILSIWQIFLFLFVILLVETEVLQGDDVAVSTLVVFICFLPFLLGVFYVLLVYIRFRRMKHDNSIGERFTSGESDEDGNTTNVEDIDMVALLLRTTVCVMRDSESKNLRSGGNNSRLTMMMADTDHISLVDIKHARSEDRVPRIDEEV